MNPNALRAFFKVEERRGGEHGKHSLTSDKHKDTNTLVKGETMFKRNYRKNIGLMAGVEFFCLSGHYQLLDSISQSKRMSLWQIGLLKVFSCHQCHL